MVHSPPESGVGRTTFTSRIREVIEVIYARIREVIEVIYARIREVNGGCTTFTNNVVNGGCTTFTNNVVYTARIREVYAAFTDFSINQAGFLRGFTTFSGMRHLHHFYRCGIDHFYRCGIDHFYKSGGILAGFITGLLKVVRLPVAKSGASPCC